MALCETAKSKVFKQNRPGCIFRSRPVISAMTHFQKTQTVYLQITYCLWEQQENITLNDQSAWWSYCYAAQRRRWTKQRDTQRGDIICWRVLSLPSSRLVTKLLLAVHSGQRNNCFHVLKVPGQCTHLYALPLTHTYTHTRTLSQRHTHTEPRLVCKNLN